MPPSDNSQHVSNAQNTSSTSKAIIKKLQLSETYFEQHKKAIDAAWPNNHPLNGLALAQAREILEENIKAALLEISGAD